MTKFKQIVIIEDEEMNAERLRRLITQLRPNYIVLTVLESVVKAADWLSSNDAPDLIFMDIQLSDGESFQLFELADVKAPVIFTTAYNEYALKAFKYTSIDYLLKPIESEDLEQAIIKFEQSQLSEIDQQSVIDNLMQFLAKKEYRTRFLIPHRDSYIQLLTTNIAYFCSEFGGSFAMTFDGKKHAVSETLETLEQQLDSKVFFRANRQFIIQINAIEKVSNYFNSKLKLEIKQCTEDVVVSRQRASSLKEWLDF